MFEFTFKCYHQMGCMYRCLGRGKQVTHIAGHGYFFYLNLQNDHDIKSRTQILVQTFSNLQISVYGFLQFVANDVEDGEHHWHHLTHQSVSYCAELLLKYPLCLQLISNTVPLSVGDLIVVTWTEVMIIGRLLQHFPPPSTRKLS
jgi:hypothetical protein